MIMTLSLRRMPAGWIATHCLYNPNNRAQQSMHLYAIFCISQSRTCISFQTGHQSDSVELINKIYEDDLSLCMKYNEYE